MRSDVVRPTRRGSDTPALSLGQIFLGLLCKVLVGDGDFQHQPLALQIVYPRGMVARLLGAVRQCCAAKRSGSFAMASGLLFMVSRADASTDQELPDAMGQAPVPPPAPCQMGTMRTRRGSRVWTKTRPAIGFYSLYRTAF
jgi:hypothetical protein